MESITTRRFYTRLLDALATYDSLDIPNEYPHATDDVRRLVEEIGEQLEAQDRACVVQVDQLEDAARDARTFRQLLAALQSVGDLGEAKPMFVLFLFGTPRAAERIDKLRETLSSRLVAKNRSLERFGFAETDELIARWLAWARDEEYEEGYPSDPFTASAIERVVERSDGTPRRSGRNATMLSALVPASSETMRASKSPLKRSMSTSNPNHNINLRINRHQ